MNYADLVLDVTTSSGTGPFVLAGTSAASGYQTIAALGGNGVTFPYRAKSGILWETGIATITATNTVSRAPSASSSGGAAVSFPAGAEFICTLTAVQVNDLAKLSDGVTLASLTDAGTVLDTDFVPINRGGVDMKVTALAFKTYSGVAAAAATAVTMTGPTSGAVGAPSTNFTVGANGTISGTVVVTPSDGGAGGTFTPTTRSISSATPTGTFTYTPASSGAKTISATNNGSLTNPSNITYTASAAAATAVTMSGPTTGTVSVASTNFTIAANGAITGTVVVTPSDAGGGGTFTPTTVSISSSTPSATFTYTPSATAGARTISVTNNGSLTNPSNITYTSTAAATTSPTTITQYQGPIKSSITSANKYGDSNGKSLFTADTSGTNSNIWVFGVQKPTVAYSGWSQSATVPPADKITTVQRDGGSNGLVPFSAISDVGSGSSSGNYLWIPVGSGTTTWYLWIEVDGDARCMNPSGTTATGI